MKKVMMLFLCVILLASFLGCNFFFDYQNGTIDNFDIVYSKALNKAFVSSYNWDGTEETKNIVIPEEYNGIKITALGGCSDSSLPYAFSIKLPESYLNDLCDEVNQWIGSTIYEDIGSVDTVYLNFNLHISKNINKIPYHTLDSFYEGAYFDGEDYHTKVIVVLLYNITCDEGNKTFYAKEGKLYYKQSAELVPDILYFDHQF